MIKLGGFDLPALSHQQIIQCKKKLAGFKDRDFKVKLGSIIEKDIREYYLSNRFSFLEEKFASMLS